MSPQSAIFFAYGDAQSISEFLNWSYVGIFQVPGYIHKFLSGFCNKSHFSLDVIGLMCTQCTGSQFDRLKRFPQAFVIQA